jgi:hypothetical protein
VTVSIAGIGPFANLGTEERNKRAEAPVGESVMNTSCLGALRENAILAHRVRSRDRWRCACGCYPRCRGRARRRYMRCQGRGARCQGWSSNHGSCEHIPDACDEGWDGTRADISCYTSDDTQGTHDERGDRRLQVRGEVCREQERKSSLAPEQTPNHGDPNAPFSEYLKVYEDVGRCERTCSGDGDKPSVSVRSGGRVTSRLAR